MKNFFRTLITRDYRFNAMFIMFSFDGLLFVAVWLLFFRPSENAETITRNLVIAMLFFALLSFFALLQTLNKMKRLRLYQQELEAEALRKKQVAAREKLKKI